nr:vegetative cell wall protein gp1-like [Aegilops tauschii subsp. strangulata]
MQEPPPPPSSCPAHPPRLTLPSPASFYLRRRAGPPSPAAILEQCAVIPGAKKNLPPTDRAGPVRQATTQPAHASRLRRSRLRRESRPTTVAGAVPDADSSAASPAPSSTPPPPLSYKTRGPGPRSSSSAATAALAGAPVLRRSAAAAALRSDSPSAADPTNLTVAPRRPFPATPLSPPTPGAVAPFIAEPPPSSSPATSMPTAAVSHRPPSSVRSRMDG